MQRSYLQVLEEILVACREPKVRSQLVGETGVSMRRLHFCLKDLLKQDFVRFHRRKRTYVTTEKGLRFLQLHGRLEGD
jgi:predicted transcriptional regulator